MAGGSTQSNADSRSDVTFVGVDHDAFGAASGSSSTSDTSEMESSSVGDDERRHLRRGAPILVVSHSPSAWETSGCDSHRALSAASDGGDGGTTRRGGEGKSSPDASESDEADVTRDRRDARREAAGGAAMTADGRSTLGR